MISETERQRRSDNMRQVNARKPQKDEAYYREFIKARVKIDEIGCWLWQKFKKPPPNAYGLTYAFGRNWLVHRLVYRLWVGPLDPALDICHKCDIKHCCNPDHLWQGTPKENMQDAAKKKIWSRQHKTECPKGHPYEGDNLYVNRKGNRRSCKMCARIRGRLKMGWSLEEAATMPPIPQNAPTARRKFGKLTGPQLFGEQS